ncbi:hypothetical protein [Acinetobacter pittii]|uniref:hypothetical protein n=1 Tax=Acinetobacter pittii TaxID=48296 RepID=UPI000992B027|nr:hypothetical protein [Acinetobacter pittii]AQV14973.1 hypothetical protein BMU11_05180 [Acinetobacter pittii]MDV8153636.1 hypothetical protein [Acinetobacter pittii]
MLEIIDFPHDNNFWKVEWIGGVYNDTDGEPRIRIYLAQIKPNIERKHTLSNASLEISNNQYISSVHDIKIGVIQFVTIGSVWKNGIRDISFTSQHQQFTFNSNTEHEVCYQNVNGNVAETGSNHTTEWNNHLTNRYYLITNSEARSAGNYLNVFYDTNNFSRIYIPSIVIFQSCYITSPKAARHLIFGQINKLLDTDTSGFIDNKTFRIHLHRDYKDIEAPMIANIATNFAAKSGLRILRQSLLKESNSIETPYPKRIKISFPFSKDFSLKVKGKYIMDNNKAYGFLVTEIIEFTTKFEFSKLIILRKNSNQKGKIQTENMQAAYEGRKELLPQKIDNPHNEDNQPELLNFTHDQVSSQYQDKKLDFTLCANISDLEILKEEKEIQRYQNASFTNLNLEYTNNVSTGPTVNSTNGVSELQIEPKLPVNLEYFFDVLEILNKSGYKFESIAVNNAKEHPRGIINQFNRFIKNLHKWHLQDDDETPRPFIVAEMAFKGSFYYLIDIAPRKGAALSAQLIRAHTGEQIAALTFKILLNDLARRTPKGWGVLDQIKYAQKWEHYRIEHNRNNKPELVAKNIIKNLPSK